MVNSADDALGPERTGAREVEPHSEFRVPFKPVEDWVLYLAPRRAKRLIVFVHGFMGRAVTTWDQFSQSGEESAWWSESDLLFVGYDSIKDGITAVASRVRHHLPRFYPDPLAEAVSVAGAVPREDASAAYDELILVGHSLGGLILRRVLADAAQDWIDRRGDPDEVKPAVLDAQLRLFSPASAGFRAAGALGIFRATGFWSAVEMFLRRSSAYIDLQPGSEPLVNTRLRTERLVTDHPDATRALKARILWANPEEVVLAERYSTDFVDDSVDETTHTTVCKPTTSYKTPRTFVERGRTR